MYRPISKLTGGALAATGAVLAICAVTVVLLLSTSAPSSAAAPHAGGWQTAAPAASIATATTISARRTSLGTILVGPGGETLYAFTRDGHDRDVCASVRGCLAVWPMVTAHGSVSAGHGVSRSLLNFFFFDWANKLIYSGHPLYGFAQGSGPGDTTYVGTTEFGGSWPAVSPTGHLVH